MTDKTIGFIGCGNMAKAMIGGILKAKVAAPEQVIASNPSPQKLEQARREFGIHTTGNNCEAAASDILVLAVKPHLYGAVITEIRDSVRPGTLVIMIAAGQSIAKNEARFGRAVKLARAMPNTPALIGEGMTAVCFSSSVTPQEQKTILSVLESFGRVSVTPESLIDAVAGVSGSSPAYVYLFIEALADGAVREGMPRDQAYHFAAQSVLGAAKMVLETGLHPGVLKDQVCSPGGTTIAAVAALEEDGLRACVMHAVHACTERSREMSRS